MLWGGISRVYWHSSSSYVGSQPDSSLYMREDLQLPYRKEEKSSTTQQWSTRGVWLAIKVLITVLLSILGRAALTDQWQGTCPFVLLHPFPRASGNLVLDVQALGGLGLQCRWVLLEGVWCGESSPQGATEMQPGLQDCLGGEGRLRRAREPPVAVGSSKGGWEQGSVKSKWPLSPAVQGTLQEQREGERPG